MIRDQRDIVRRGYDRRNPACEATGVRWIHDPGVDVQWTRFVPEGDFGHALVDAAKPGAPDA